MTDRCTRCGTAIYVRRVARGETLYYCRDVQQYWHEPWVVLSPILWVRWWRATP